MNKLLTILVLILLPVLLVAGKTETKLKTQPSTKATTDLTVKQDTPVNSKIMVTGPSIKSASYTMKTSAGPLASIQTASGKSVRLQGTICVPIVSVTPMSPIRDDSPESGSLDDDALVITEYALNQNYPNPFNPSTSITFDLVESEHTRIVVFNSLGQTVATLVNGPMNAGRHTVTFEAADLPSGLYFYRLEAGDFAAVKKMVLMK